MRFETTGWTGLLIVLAAVLILPAAPAQTYDEQSVEGRLLEILRQKGVIDDAEFEELRQLETELREESSLELQLEDEISEMVARIGADQPTSGYKIGKGFSWQTADEKFKLTIGGRLQVRFTYDFYDDNPGTDDEDEPNFDVSRARIWLAGHAFEFFKYKFQFDIAGDEADTSVMGTKYSSSNRLTELKDAYVDFVKWDPFNIRGGQFKAPYSRQHLTSSGKLEFVDRTLTDQDFARGRQPGLMIFGMLGGADDKLFEYYAAAMDGEGENKDNNDKGLMWVGRVAFNPFGGLAYTQSDLRPEDQRGEFLMAIGLNGYYHKDDNHVHDKDNWAIGGDLTAMWEGFFFTFELHYREEGVSGGDDIEIWGWFAQLGYMIVPETFEIAVRVVSVDFENSTDETSQREYLVALGYFMAGHNLKIQADFGRVEQHFHHHDDNINDWRLRIQFQIIF